MRRLLQLKLRYPSYQLQHLLGALMVIEHGMDNIQGDHCAAPIHPSVVQMCLEGN